MTDTPRVCEDTVLLVGQEAGGTYRVLLADSSGRATIAPLIARFGSGAGQTDDIRIDAVTNSLQIVDNEHHEIHEGDHYFVNGYQDLSITNVLDFTWLMPNTTKWIHWTWSISTESETLWQVYEGATATSPLANAITPVNSNRNSANLSATVMKYEVQSNLTAANTDTSVAGALLIASGICGSGKDSGFLSRSHEVIMKQNTLYCLRATATVAGFLSFSMQWYEHTSKN